MEPAETLLQFPCAFPVKVVGLRTDGFAQQMVDLVLALVPDFRPETVEMRASKAATYLSLTLTVTVASQAQLDAVYRALSGHPAVKFVL
ncbi:MAG: DUF493 domain-containing protein [Betaproteobacteria bacterium]|jgi:uncharacterized protein|nr:MAG: DUF493 domain-containing protein [Betaproteobacteria bacterium]